MSGVPIRAAIVVIMIGRKRINEASKIASSGGLPDARSASTAKSTIMMPFFLTRPTSMITPTKAYIDKSVQNTNSVRRAPNPAKGSADKMVSG